MTDYEKAKELCNQWVALGPNPSSSRVRTVEITERLDPMKFVFKVVLHQPGVGSFVGYSNDPIEAVQKALVQIG